MFKERSVVTNFWLECSPFGLVSSVHYCSSESQTSRPEAVSKSHSSWGGGEIFLFFFIFEGSGQTHRQMSPHVLVCKHVLSPSHIITPMHRLHLFPFLLACLILSHTSTQHSLTSPGIWSFYRASVCWRGQWYGRAVSPSSDWISDQYPVPCRPASSGQADHLRKPVLVV